MASYPDPAVQRQIANCIRGGCFAHVAAEACGVSRATFDRWVKHGQARNAAATLADFAKEICTAKAQARLKAEMRAFEENPRAWLEHGPGRDMPGDPGWSSSVRPPAGGGDSFNPLAHPEFMDVCNQIVAELAKFPEVHAHVARCIEMLLTRKHESATNTIEGDEYVPHPPPAS